MSASENDHLEYADAMIIIPLLLLSVGYQPDAGTPPPLPDLRCGGYSLFIAIDALGLAPDQYETFENEIGPPGPSGYSMLQLAEQAGRLGAHPLAVRTSIENLQFRNEPFTCICLLEGSHYVLLTDLDESYASIIDFPRSYRTSIDAFRGQWGGEALLIGLHELRSEESITALRRWRAAIIPLAIMVVLLIIVSLVISRIRRRMRSISTLKGLLLLGGLWFSLCSSTG